MNIPNKILRDYIVCLACVCIGYAFAPLDDILPLSVARGIVWLAVLGIGVTTFKWAGIRGFPALDREGHVQVAHVVRSLVMTGIMTVIIVLVSSPIFVLVGKLSRQ
jgi:hypothetical protein